MMRSVLTILLLLSLPAPSSAFQNFQAIPGGIVGIELDEEDGASVSATFGSTRIPVISVDKKWLALVPLNFDIVPGFYIVATLNDEKDYKSYTFKIKPGNRPLYQVTLPEEQNTVGDTDTSFESEVSEVDGEVSNPDLDLVLPVDAPVFRQFGQIFISNTSTLLPFNGIRFDISRDNTPVVSPVFGQVKDIQSMNNGKWRVIIDHGNGMVSIFHDLTSLSINHEEWLTKGAEIGKLAINDAVEIMPHWSLQMNQAWIDPMILVSSEVTLPSIPTTAADATVPAEE